ncbi:glutathione S-transferase family protein [Aurantimonas sp. VKM B-3413]|uniref:glutathione S-transferase family protein n=1 Tax=Aurantimonas sp. VKM B-3413 TaxID=2779401 RepID=UPI001E5EDA17|nr:glutathione S-transferase family protein [Aurantimonas sp. VKM B-3413]MCB8838781.1 glutathione S-transferase family protein [Aurantimonas sp. VKM B-3413]
MITVWGRANSSNVQAVMWAIGELGLAYERHDVGHRHGGNDTAEFLAMNPNGTVPVVRDADGEPLWESAAILRYLAWRYGEPPFWPAELAARSHIDKWAEWAKLNIAGGFTAPIFWRVVRTPAKERDEAAIAAALASLGRKLDIAEVQLRNHAFLAGHDFTLADIQFGHILHRYFDIEIERPSHPAIESYYDRLAERPAYREHVMISYEDLKVG